MNSSQLKRLATLFSVAVISFSLNESVFSSTEQIVPERRVAITQHIDFYGSDLDPEFDTTLSSCELLCLRDKECKAFTFNAQSNSCFPKSNVAEKRPFDGAVSGEVFDADPSVLESSLTQIKALKFLPNYYFSDAANRALNVPRNYVTNGYSEEYLLRLARKASSEKNYYRAFQLTAAAIGASDSASVWVELSRSALVLAKNDRSRKWESLSNAAAAAVNGFVRARSEQVQANALAVLAKTLELRSEGSLSIPALRLAQKLAPRFETEEALDRAISLFGFRVVEHDVNNNARSPRICMTFSESLVAEGIEYSDYVRFPVAGLATDVNDRQLCIDGVKHGQRYQFSLREGLPAANGETLQKTTKLNVYVKDRDPSVRFTGRSYVLPRSQNATVPIVSVNLEKVDLKIYRVGDRNILRSIQDGFFSKPLSEYREEELADSLGQEVWTGSGETGLELNQDVTTQLPIGDALSTFEPGVYVLRARVPGADVYATDAASQWFVVTDLGLTSMTGTDGTHVFVRSLASADAVAGVKVKLITKSNTVLAEATTDASGYVRFAPGFSRGTGGATPALLTASTGDTDFAFLSLSDAAFDLSDRGVEGRDSPPPVDIFLSTDRGAYRVGETVYATALVRDSKAESIQNLSLTAVITRPDGVEYSRKVLDDKGAGGLVYSMTLPDNAQRGTWSLRLYVDPKANALASRSFLVEDFLPERIDFDLSLPQGDIHLDNLPTLDLSARYLYGAPGANLVIEGSVQITASRELEDYPGYLFGLKGEPFSPVVEYFGGIETDADGNAHLTLPAVDAGNTNNLLTMQADIRVREGSGRPVERRISRALAPDSIKLGIKPLFEGTLSQGEQAEFNIIGIGTDSMQQDLPQVSWKLNRLTTHYQWYTRYGDWNYEPIVSREVITNGTIDIQKDTPAKVEMPTEWGMYELLVETDSDRHIVSSYTFYSGWYSSSKDNDTPDTLEFGLDKANYEVGEAVQLRLVPRYAGKAHISVMNNRLIENRVVDVVEGENLIELTVGKEWGAGAYVSASVIRPMNIAAGHNPARALGLSWATVDPGKHRLTASFVTADEVEPRGSLNASLDIDGLSPGDTAYATIAAIDVGVLNITGFKSPNPDDHYFGQRKLGMAMRDVYGRLIDGLHGTPGQVRSGGDAFAAMRLASPPSVEQLVSFFSGQLQADENGHVNAQFDMPDFNGTVRLMAIVWSKTGVGQTAKDITVSNPIVLTASLPRFLAPNDESRLLVELAHVSGSAGDVELEVSADNGLYMDQSNIPSSVVLENLGRTQLSVPITARASGDSEISISIRTPDGLQLDKTYTISIRSNDPLVSRTERIELAANEEFKLDAGVFSNYQQGSGHATLTMGPMARFDVPGLLSALDRYPYGCTEQITSRALPLLYFDSVTTQMGLGNKAEVSDRISRAITDVLLNQAAHGGFGLWSPSGGDLWLDSYVSDFLSRARAEGHTIPDQAFRLAMDNLRNSINYAGDFEKGGEAIAYALMVLAREGAAAIGDLRYYADVKADAFATPLALAQLGAALTFYGEQSRGNAMFRKASERLADLIKKPERTGWRDDYGTYLRDAAAVLTLATEAGSTAIDEQSLVKYITPTQTLNSWRSTQENMWSLLAANALLEAPDANRFTVNGEAESDATVQVLDAQTVNQKSLLVRNISSDLQTIVLSSYGLPDKSEPAGGNGYRIERKYYAVDGTEVSSDTAALNDRLVVVLKIIPRRQTKARLMINDPLPAGFEIDNPSILRGGDISQLDWLRLYVEPVNAEFRSERFLAAVDWSSVDVFHLAYMVRAISPGIFHHPAASVEDMYRPQFRARTATSTIQITE